MCFAGVPSETLAECASLCVHHGVLQLRKRKTWRHAEEVTGTTCTAFAYHSVDRRCVRLGPGVDHLIFEPFLQNFSNPRGWVNFRLRDSGAPKDEFV
mmetsp:Transcript_93572/g.213986  ORF Transcript_93572/g.213986 Transcript_93572/m.213986 type:complete len:97 (+) Transcript_93572:1624-1914(+)